MQVELPEFILFAKMTEPPPPKKKCHLLPEIAHDLSEMLQSLTGLSKDNATSEEIPSAGFSAYCLYTV